MFLNSAPEFCLAVGTDDVLAICIADDFGLGVAALTDFAAGAVLDRFSGDIGRHIEQHSLQVGPDRHITGTRFIGFLSHGCAPNSRLDMARRELVALRAIAAGELLTIDYTATEDRLYVQFACHCGAEACRHWITGRADPTSAEGERHLAGLVPDIRAA